MMKTYNLVIKMALQVFKSILFKALHKLTRKLTFSGTFLTTHPASCNSCVDQVESKRLISDICSLGPV